MDPIYAAGFFDGEGCISVSRLSAGRDRPAYLLDGAIGNTYLPILQEFQAQWGGSIAPQKKYKAQHKDRWIWHLHGDNLVRFLQDLFPHLHEKTLQVEMALQFVAEKTARNVRSRGRLSAEDLALREGFYLALREAKR